MRKFKSRYSIRIETSSERRFHSITLEHGDEEHAGVLHNTIVKESLKQVNISESDVTDINIMLLHTYEQL